MKLNKKLQKALEQAKTASVEKSNFLFTFATLSNGEKTKLLLAALFLKENNFLLTQRDEVRAYLQENGIPTMIYYPKGLHQQKVFENCCLYGETLPVTTSICRRTLAIPVSPYLAEEDQDKIIRLIREKTGA